MGPTRLPNRLQLEPKLNFQHSLNRPHNGERQSTQLTLETFLGCGRDLVGHGLTLFTVHRYHRLTGIQPPRIAGQRHHLKPIQCGIWRHCPPSLRAVSCVFHHPRQDRNPPTRLHLEASDTSPIRALLHSRASRSRSVSAAMA